MSSITKQMLSVTLAVILIPILFIPTFSSNFNEFNTDTTNVNSIELSYTKQIHSSKFVWPTPGYTRITSPFGRRSSPTKNASSFHLGIDIGAPAGTHLVAVSDSIVTDLGFHRFWWLQYYIKSKSFAIHLSSCRSSLSYFNRAKGDCRSNHWTSRTQKCLWYKE